MTHLKGSREGEVLLTPTKGQQCCRICGLDRGFVALGVQKSGHWVKMADLKSWKQADTEAPRTPRKPQNAGGTRSRALETSPVLTYPGNPATLQPAIPATHARPPARQPCNPRSLHTLTDGCPATRQPGRPAPNGFGLGGRACHAARPILPARSCPVCWSGPPARCAGPGRLPACLPGVLVLAACPPDPARCAGPGRLPARSCLVCWSWSPARCAGPGRLPGVLVLAACPVCWSWPPWASLFN